MHKNQEFRRLVPLSFLILLCGCGGVELKNTNTLFVTPSTVMFGTVNVGQTATASISLQNRGLKSVDISQLNIDTQSFSVLGQTTLPATIAPGASYSLTVKFNPAAAGSAKANLAVLASQTAAAITSISLTGTGAPSIQSLACTLSSISGSGTDVCTVTLNVAAASGGYAVDLSSSASAVGLPASVTVPAGATQAHFNANVSTVSSAQSATLTATASGSSTTFALQLVPNGSSLSFNATSIAFGSTALNDPLTQSLIVTASGTLPVSITAATLSGTGFTIVGTTLPITLNPGQSATLNVEFNPNALGAAAGQLLIASNASVNANAAIALSGTGVAYEVQLTWNAPAETSSSISGYKVYRSAGGSSTYQLLNSSVEAQTAYTDTTVQSGSVYDYIVESVDTSGAVSAPSNTTTVTIP
jgi:hypothetical protein